MSTAEAVIARQQISYSAVLHAQSHTSDSAVWDQLLDFDAALTAFPPADLAQAASNFCEAFGAQLAVEALDPSRNSEAH